MSEQAAPTSTAAPTTPATTAPPTQGSGVLSHEDLGQALLGLKNIPSSDPRARKLAPIPEKIDGVRADAPGPAPKASRSFADMEAESLALAEAGDAAREKARPRARGKEGKFLSPAQAATAAERGESLDAHENPDPAGEGAEESETAQEVEASPWTPRKLLGHEFKTQAELEDRMRITEGRARKHQAAEKLSADAVKIANGWKDYASHLANQVEELRAYVQAQTGEPAGAKKAKAPSGDAGDPGDVEAFLGSQPWEGLAKLADEKGIHHALHHVSRRLAERADAKVAALQASYSQQLQELRAELANIRPVTDRVAQTEQEQQEQAHNQKVASDLFTQVAGTPDPKNSGAYRYPELIQGAHPQASAEQRQVLIDIIGIWQGYNPAYQVTPESVRSAVLDYRESRPSRQQPPPPPQGAGEEDSLPEVLEGSGTPRSSTFSPRAMSAGAQGSESEVIRGIQRSFLGGGNGKGRGNGAGGFSHRF